MNSHSRSKFYPTSGRKEEKERGKKKNSHGRPRTPPHMKPPKAAAQASSFSRKFIAVREKKAYAAGPAAMNSNRKDINPPISKPSFLTVHFAPQLERWDGGGGQVVPHIPMMGAPRVKTPKAPTLRFDMAFRMDARNKPAPRPTAAVLSVSSRTS